MSSDAEILPAQAGKTATVKPDRRVYATAVEHALWFQVGVFGLAFLLMLALPARRGHNTPAKSV
jgi:hypothetical protein